MTTPKAGESLTETGAWANSKPALKEIQKIFSFKGILRILRHSGFQEKVPEPPKEAAMTALLMVYFTLTLYALIYALGAVAYFFTDVLPGLF